MRRVPLGCAGVPKARSKHAQGFQLRGMCMRGFTGAESPATDYSFLCLIGTHRDNCGDKSPVISAGRCRLRVKYSTGGREAENELFLEGASML